MDEYNQALYYETAYRYSLITIGIISTLLFPYIIFLICFKFPEKMPKLNRFFLFNISITTYLIVFIYSIWQPLPLYHLRCKFFNYKNSVKLKF